MQDRTEAEQRCWGEGWKKGIDEGQQMTRRVNRMNLAYFHEIGTVWILSLVVGFGLGYLYRYCTAREVN